MSIDSDADLRGMQRAGHAVAVTLAEMCQAARAGITTADLDALAARTLARLGAQSAPKLVYQFPGHTCISVNEEIVHGVPGPRVLRPGDVVKLDVTAECDGYIADAATTVLLAPVDPVAARMKHCALEALAAGLEAARAGRFVSDIGRAVSACANAAGFAVVRELCGHGVGRKIHEQPEVPNYPDRFSRQRLSDGLVIAVEPMLSATRSRALETGDGWTIRTKNRSLAVHEEHTIVVTNGAPIVLTAA